MAKLPLRYNSLYDDQQDSLYSAWNYGFFSNCTVTLWNMFEVHLASGRLPSRIDYSLAFSSFRNPEQVRLKSDLYPLFFKPNPNAPIPNAPTSRERKYPNYPNYPDYPDHHGLYRFLNYSCLNPFIDKYSTPSDQVVKLRELLVRRYDINPSMTLAVVYRGTDKHKEVMLASPDAFLDLARRLLTRHPGYRLWIQTDELEVRKMFCTAFGQSCFYLDEMPCSSSGRVVHGLQDEELNIDRSEFGILLVAVNSLLAQVDIVVNHTGNMGLWLCLFRGHARGVWQFDATGRPVNPDFPWCYKEPLRHLVTRLVHKARRTFRKVQRIF